VVAAFFSLTAAYLRDKDRTREGNRDIWLKKKNKQLLVPI
jgi:hypothetical protein